MFIVLQHTQIHGAMLQFYYHTKNAVKCAVCVRDVVAIEGLLGCSSLSFSRRLAFNDVFLCSIFRLSKKEY